VCLLFYFTGELMKYYAGIGSRETPSEVQGLMERVAKYLAGQEYILRSGGAKGSDTAFQKGVESWIREQGKTRALDHMHIFIPSPKSWLTEDKGYLYKEPTDEQFKMAEEYHPNWAACKEYARLLHARNCSQILGEDLQTPCDFVICWTKGGTGAGGTGQAIRVATGHNIPIFDLGNYDEVQEGRVALNEFLKEFV
jgi:hypothetical protein